MSASFRHQATAEGGIAPGQSPTAGADRPLTVSELSGRIVRLLEDGVGVVTVTGEVSNLRMPASGHCYFLLKDATSAIHAVCFRSVACRQAVRLRDGQSLEVRGRVTAYAQRSEYQIVVEAMREAGLGALMQRFLELKEKLKAEGLFDERFKQAIPRLPRRVGLITSATGAALRDMLNVLGRRARGLTIYLAPAAVQGEAAPGEIVAALERLQRHARAEVIIVGRGGGSIEDLWAFNDERVVRAIAACAIPVVSAVGHETDTTLADYAADLRAPTPSAAAELISAHYGDMAELLGQYQRRLGRCIQYLVAERRARLSRAASSWGLRQPRERLDRAMQRLDDLHEALESGMRQGQERRGERLRALDERLRRVNPQRRVEHLRERLERSRVLLATLGPARWEPSLALRAQRLDQVQSRLRGALDRHQRQAQWALASLRQRLECANPECILQRGYSIITHGKRDRVITAPEQVREGEIIRIRSAGGPWRAVALNQEPDLFESTEE